MGKIKNGEILKTYQGGVAYDRNGVEIRVGDKVRYKDWNYIVDGYGALMDTGDNPGEEVRHENGGKWAPEQAEIISWSGSPTEVQMPIKTEKTEDFEVTKAALKSALEEIERLKAERDSARSDRQSMTDQNNRLKAANEEISHKVADLQNELVIVKDANKTCEGMINDKLNEIVLLKGMVSGKDEHIAELEGQIAHIEACIPNLVLEDYSDDELAKELEKRGWKGDLQRTTYLQIGPEKGATL